VLVVHVVVGCVGNDAVLLRPLNCFDPICQDFFRGSKIVREFNFRIRVYPDMDVSGFTLMAIAEKMASG
jgi:hypothetical protein